MAITTTLQPKYSIRLIAIALVSLVLGAWGLLDYLVFIPNKAAAYERGEVYREVSQALKEREAALGGDSTAREAMARALTVVTDALARAGVSTDEDVRELIRTTREIGAFAPRDREQWRSELLLFRLALGELAAGRTGDAALRTFQDQAYEMATTRVSQASGSPPGRFDRATQWMFILCLPFAPWFAWQVLRMRRRRFRLDDEGTLHSPAGEWPADEIADIDMGRWMAKSIAWVVHRDGRRLKLDDYIYKGTHLIVGKLASEKHPGEWDDQAKPVKATNEAAA